MMNNSNSTDRYILKPQYENNSIPTWGFNSSCHWLVAVKVDLALSSVGVFYNLIISLLPLFVSRMYCMKGAVVSSYTLGAFLGSLYFAFYDSRLLISAKSELEHEKNAQYLVIWFLSYHFMLHMHLLSWDQHHAIMRFKAHRRFTTRSKLVQVEVVVWGTAIVFTLLEAFFIHNPVDYPKHHHVFQFRLIIVLISMAFLWFGPLVLMLFWNFRVFSFLLKVTHNGYESKTPPERTDGNENLPELVPDPWNRAGHDDEMFYEDPPEYATLPKDVKFQLTQSFANFVTLTTFATLIILWSTYHVFWICHRAKILENYKIYEIIFTCELYITLYAVAKFVLLLNPLWGFFYRKEMRGVRRFGVPHE